MTMIRSVLKYPAMWLVLMAGQMIGGMVGQALFEPPEMVMLKDGPFDVTQGMAVINVVMAVIFGLLASHLRGIFRMRSISLLALFYSVQTILSLIEAIYFNRYLKLADSLLWLIGVGNLIQAVPAALFAAWLWRGRDGVSPVLRGSIWKIPAIIVLYIFAYFAAGFLIAWQGEAVRTYYEQGMNINQAELALLQVGRGLIWAGLAWIGATQLTGSKVTRASLTGLAFSGFMAIQLLLPTSFMPWEVRLFHLVEVSISNFLFGFAAVMIWLVGTRITGPQKA